MQVRGGRQYEVRQAGGGVAEGAKRHGAESEGTRVVRRQR